MQTVLWTIISIQTKILNKKLSKIKMMWDNKKVDRLIGVEVDWCLSEL